MVGAQAAASFSVDGSDMSVVIRILWLGLLLLVLLSGVSWAKGGELGLGLGAGTGFLGGYVGGKDSRTLAERYPTFLDFDLQYEATDTVAVALRAEVAVEKGEALTLAPAVIVGTGGDVVSLYGRFGVAVRLVPNYYGVDLGIGFVWHFLKHLGLGAELHAEPLFLGKGLTGGVLVPVLAVVSFRGNV